MKDANTPPAGHAVLGGDCNDAVAAIHPNATEVPYNGVDDDCDGDIDETGTVTTTLLSSSCGVTLTSIQSLVGIQTAYPSPFTADFAVGVTTSGKGNVQLKVYDMLGKLIESREVRLSELDMQKVGSQYPSGVYNIVVSQDGIVKTLRVIKR